MFQGKVSEAQLIDLMNQVAEMAADKNMKVEISKHKFDDEDDLDIDQSFYSLEAFMNRHQIGNVQTPDDRLIALINERLDAISVAKERIKFYLEEIEMFMPRKKK
jgi:hypothetical protein